MPAASPLKIDRPFVLAVLGVALPVAVQLLMQSLLGMADITMVGVLGGTPLAAVGLAAKIHFLLLVFMSGTATACAILVAQYLGAGQVQRYQNTVALTLVLGQVLMLPFVAFLLAAPGWLPLLNPDPSVCAVAAQYLRITAPALLLVQAIVVYEASLRGLGQTKLSLLASAVSVAANILLNYLLIFGHWGLPALGPAGAAWGTLIARALQLLVIAGWLYLAGHEFALRWRQFAAAIDWARLRHFALFALPLVANYLFWAIGNTTYHVLTGFAGTEALAVMGVMVPLEMCFFAIYMGLASASSVMIGHALGGDDRARAWVLFKVFDRLAIALVVCMSGALWLGRDAILALYGNLEPTTAALLREVLAVFCLTVWLRVLNLMRIVGVLRAGGDTQFCLWMDMAVMWCLGIPVYALAIFYSSYGFVAIYALIFVEDAAKIIPVHWRLNSRRWLRNLSAGH